MVLTTPAFAANRVTEINLDVTLEQDGSAYVVQTWSGSFDEGTECYFPVKNLGEMTLSGLTVSDGQGAFATLEGWDTSASFGEKARRCGLNPVEDGYEVCWGITEYGQNRYAVEYELGGLTAAYEDADGFLFQFVPDEMNIGPTDVTVRIHTRDGSPLHAENAAVWAFGFDGQIGFGEDGGVLAYTETPLRTDNSVILMLRLEKGLLTPTRTISGSFEDVKTRALEGSDYSKDEGDGTIWLVVIAAAVLAVIALVWVGGKEERRVKKLAKTADYWREAPIGGNLEASFVLANRFYLSDDDENLVAAALTRLLAQECLMPLTDTDVGLAGREKKSVSLRLIKPPAEGGLTIRLLYELLSQAAGGDGILQEDELENYCKQNYTALLRVVEEAKRDGGDTLIGISCYKSPLSTDTLAGLTDRGREQLLKLIGYKNYLRDFSLITERGVNEAIIWQDCLTYAALLGIGEQVMKDLRKFAPDNDIIPKIETTYYAAYRYNYITYAAAKAAQAEATRASGGGGHSSFGGGGGFSGGGHGGGTR